MAVRTPTKQELAALLAAHGIADFVTGGKFAKYEMRALKSMLKKLGPAVGRAGPRLGATAWLVARRHPVVAVASLLAAGVIYEDEVEQVVRDLEDGVAYTQDLVEELNRRGQVVGGATRRAGEFFMGTGQRQPRVREQAGAGVRGAESIFRSGRSFGVLPTQTTRKKRPSKFNSAVKAGMLAVKKSKSYGGKGKIKPAKKAFSVVTKMAAAKKKKKKAPKSGIRRTIWNAMRGYK